MTSATHTGSLCNACGEEFGAQLLAMVFSDYLVEEYYACPKCLSKVRGVERQEQTEVDEAEEAESSLSMEVQAPTNTAVGCGYHLGFLKNRPKKTPIPEECLTCSKMIECMY